MYIDDAVDGLLALLKAAGERLTVDFASGTPVSINDIVSTMSSALGVEVAVRHEGTVPEYIQFRSADTTMRDRFGFKPSISFAEGLKRLSAFLA
jgi:nucleoside-diphosphate-sugar epimerase